MKYEKVTFEVIEFPVDDVVKTSSVDYYPDFVDPESLVPDGNTREFD